MKQAITAARPCKISATSYLTTRGKGVAEIGMTLAAATRQVQQYLADNSLLPPAERWRRMHLFAACQAGESFAMTEVRAMVRHAVCELGLKVPGWGSDQLAEEVYRYAYGLDVLEDVYYDPEVDEIRINAPKEVYVQKRGRNMKANVNFKDDDHILKIVRRMILTDRVALTRSTPRVESVRADGSRVTATMPPLSRSVTVVIRKHDTFKLTEENLIASGTLNRQLLDLLITLVSCRANILIAGAAGSGKTSLLKFLCQYIHQRMRIVTLETDFELHLESHYPGRDIVALQEQADLGITLRELFRTVLRYTPDIIIVGEARAEEAQEMLKACLRGHEGSMGTIHSSSVAEAVESMTQMVLEGGNSLPEASLRREVARAFNVVIQMYSDTVNGIKKVERVTELIPTVDGVALNDLCVWRGQAGNYNKGQWEFPGSFSPRLLEKMHKFGRREAETLVAG
ncbi:MAG: pilus assembly protein CpaF [Moorella sp. (in: firmicutes)]|nr:pilus assembly protein CpaF [Moorella sp. (in: firmicutes)]